MELFWVIVGYLVVLTVCFLVGEYLRDCRLAKKAKASAEPIPEEPEMEVLPDPHQTAQILSRDLERLAEELARHYGLDPRRVEAFFATGNPPPQSVEIIDLEEQLPEE